MGLACFPIWMIPAAPQKDLATPLKPLNDTYFCSVCAYRRGLLILVLGLIVYSSMPNAITYMYIHESCTRPRSPTVNVQHSKDTLPSPRWKRIHTWKPLTGLNRTTIATIHSLRYINDDGKTPDRVVGPMWRTSPADAAPDWSGD